MPGFLALAEILRVTGKTMKEKERKAALIRCIKIFHYLLSVTVFALTWIMHKEVYETGGAARYNVYVYGIYALCFYFFSRVYNAYMIEFANVYDVTFSLCLSSTMATAAPYVLTTLAWNRLHPPWVFVGSIFVQIIVNILWGLLAVRIYCRLYPPLRTAVIYRSEADLRRLGEIKRFPKKYMVDAYIRAPKTTDEILAGVKGYEALFLVGVDASLRDGVAKYCTEQDIPGFFIPSVGDILLAGGKHIQAFSIPMFGIRTSRGNAEYLFVKRLFDIVASVIALIITSPLLLLTAISIKLCDGGPVIYKQVRLTKGGRTFRIFKFRSMRVDAEKDGVARLSSEGDDRITPVGRVIRACRLDELPQLVNILKGDMTIVGPRPERPEIAAQYEREIPEFRLRLQVKAGLTGYAQVYGRYNTDPYDKLELDLLYMNHMNTLEDLKLMFATIRILFMKESTDGVEAGKETAMSGRK